MKKLARIAVLMMLVASPVAAADFEKGRAAYKSGDYATAMKEWRPLAEQGNAKAQYNLGTIYDRGRGVPQDYAVAAGWYRKAAEQGEALSQTILGLMYVLGKGVPQDSVQAHKWLNLAASKGNKGGIKYRDIIAKEMTPGQIAEAQKLVREWLAQKKRK